VSDNGEDRCFVGRKPVTIRDDPVMDRRVARTRGRLQEALLELARERAYGDITVSDVVARAGVNRSSFYEHYTDKELLLADALDAAAHSSGADLDMIVEQIESPTPPPVLVDYLRHLAENAAVYRTALISPGVGPAIQSIGTRLTLNVARASLGIRGDPVDVPQPVIAAGQAGAFIGAVSAWIGMEPLPPADEAARWVWTVMRSFQI
jgi:AcrR family transcriptional regulator